MENNKTPKIIPEKIHILGIRILSGSIDSDNTNHSGQVPKFTTQFEVQQGLNRKEKIFQFVITTNLSALSEDGTPLNIKANYSIEITFRIDNFEDFISNPEVDNDNDLVINAILPGTLIGIAFSTVRGIILSRTQGTVMDGVILPVIDPMKLLIVKS